MKLCPKCLKQFSDDANFCPVDAARLSPIDPGEATEATETDSLSARFSLGAPLGGSRTGAVHRATDKQGGPDVAIKFVARAVTALPGVAQRLERELKQLERVQSAGVAKVLASGNRGDVPWVALELVDGAQTLADAINARGPIALDQSAHLIEAIGEALIEAAQVGVVHRDLAPKNVLFAGSEIKLINFSLPVPTNERVPGVPEFVAPEQVDGKPVDQRSNLYSLGALYYYVLTGQTVHGGSVEDVHRAHVNSAITTPSSLAPIPAPVEAVIMRALDRSPTKRFLTVRQFVDEVGRVARGESEVRTTQPMGKVARPKAELVETLLGVRSGPIAAPHANVPSAVVAAPPVAAATNQAVGQHTVIGMASGSGHAPPAAHANVPPTAGERSPWAPPSSNEAGAMAVAAMPATTTPPVVAAPVVAAPQVAAPAGKKAKGEGESKGKFRETMWFKKGELDAQAAQAAAEERVNTGKDAVGDKADSLPIDERYKDDGSITRGDKEKYSLRTGGTQMMSAIKDSDLGAGTSRVSEDALIGEMKGGRQWIFFAIIGGLVAIGIIIFFVSR